MELTKLTCKPHGFSGAKWGAGYSGFNCTGFDADGREVRLDHLVVGLNLSNARISSQNDDYGSEWNRVTYDIFLLGGVNECDFVRHGRKHRGTLTCHPK